MQTVTQLPDITIHVDRESLKRLLALLRRITEAMPGGQSPDWQSLVRECLLRGIGSYEQEVAAALGRSHV